MVQTRSMTRNRNNDASSKKSMNTCGGVPWSDLTHDVLYSVMMRLEVVDFLSFSGVCKSWRSLALPNKKTFMTSKPPMAMIISSKNTWYLQDFERKQFKIIIPHSADRICFGVTCGYLILFGEKTRDFWLVNPITRHELHFPSLTFDFGDARNRMVRGILVFSPSINEWVFVMICKYHYIVWFSIAGKGAWNHVFSKDKILDLHAFKGKIYTLNFSVRYSLCEMRLDPVPKITVIDTPMFGSIFVCFSFISSDENLYLLDSSRRVMYKVFTLGFDQVNWVPCEKTRQEYAVFHSHFKFSALVKPESWAAPSS